MNTPQEWNISLADFDNDTIIWGRNTTTKPNINSGSIFFDNLPIDIQRGLLQTTGDDAGQIDTEKLNNFFLNKAQEVIINIVRSRKMLMALPFSVLQDFTKQYLTWSVYKVIDFLLNGSVYSENVVGSSMSLGQMSISDNLSNYMISNNQWGTISGGYIMLSDIHEYKLNSETHEWEYKGNVIPIVDQKLAVNFKTGQSTADTSINDLTDPNTLLTKQEIEKVLPQYEEVWTKVSPTQVELKVDNDSGGTLTTTVDGVSGSWDFDGMDLTGVNDVEFGNGLPGNNYSLLQLRNDVNGNEVDIAQLENTKANKDDLANTLLGDEAFVKLNLKNYKFTGTYGISTETDYNQQIAKGSDIEQLKQKDTSLETRVSNLEGNPADQYITAFRKFIGDITGSATNPTDNNTTFDLSNVIASDGGKFEFDEGSILEVYLEANVSIDGNSSTTYYSLSLPASSNGKFFLLEAVRGVDGSDNVVKELEVLIANLSTTGTLTLARNRGTDIEFNTIKIIELSQLILALGTGLATKQELSDNYYTKTEGDNRYATASSLNIKANRVGGFLEFRNSDGTFLGYLSNEGQGISPNDRKLYNTVAVDTLIANATAGYQPSIGKIGLLTSDPAAYIETLVNNGAIESSYNGVEKVIFNNVQASEDIEASSFTLNGDKITTWPSGGGTSDPTKIFTSGQNAGSRRRRVLNTSIGSASYEINLQVEPGFTDKNYVEVALLNTFSSNKIYSRLYRNKLEYNNDSENKNISASTEDIINMANGGVLKTNLDTEGSQYFANKVIYDWDGIGKVKANSIKDGVGNELMTVGHLDAPIPAFEVEQKATGEAIVRTYNADFDSLKTRALETRIATLENRKFVENNTELKDKSFAITNFVVDSEGRPEDLIIPLPTTQELKGKQYTDLTNIIVYLQVFEDSGQPNGQNSIQEWHLFKLGTTWYANKFVDLFRDNANQWIELASVSVFVNPALNQGNLVLSFGDGSYIGKNSNGTRITMLTERAIYYG